MKPGKYYKHKNCRDMFIYVQNYKVLDNMAVVTAQYCTQGKTGWWPMPVDLDEFKVPLHMVDDWVEYSPKHGGR